MDYKSHQTMKKEEVSIQISTPLLQPKSKPLASNGLQFDRPPPDDEDLVHQRRLEFGQFVAREAVIDEELWVSDLIFCTLEEIFYLSIAKAYSLDHKNEWRCLFVVDSGMASG